MQTLLHQLLQSCKTWIKTYQKLGQPASLKTDYQRFYKTAQILNNYLEQGANTAHETPDSASEAAETGSLPPFISLCPPSSKQHTAATCSLHWAPQPITVRALGETPVDNVLLSKILSKVQKSFQEITPDSSTRVGKSQQGQATFELTLPPLEIQFQFPMQLIAYTEEAQHLASLPAPFTAANFKLPKEAGYFGCQVTKVQALSTLPKFSGSNILSEASSSCSSQQVLRVVLNIEQPHTTVAIDEYRNITLKTNPAETELELRVVLDSDYDLKNKQVQVQVASIKNWSGDDLVEQVTISTKKTLTMGYTI